MTNKENNIQKKLSNWFAAPVRVVVAGIGNPIRMDDFVGVKIVRDLQGKVSSSTDLIECETVPESYLQDIVELKPSHVLIVDAAVLGLKPGDIQLISPEQIADFSPITTHFLPLRIFCEYITETTAAKIGMLLVQPGNVEFGEGLTPEVSAASEKLTQILAKILGPGTFPAKNCQETESKNVGWKVRGEMGDKT